LAARCSRLLSLASRALRSLACWMALEIMLEVRVELLLVWLLIWVGGWVSR
jgi:hypothetical protein